MDTEAGSLAPDAVTRWGPNERLAASTIDTGAVSGDRYAASLMTAGSQATGASASAPTYRRRAKLPKPVASGAKHVCKAIFEGCCEELERAGGNTNHFERNNALEHLKEKLGILWKYRGQREEGFAELVNMLQAIFAKRRVEDFDDLQLACLQDVFGAIAFESEFEDEFVNNMTLRLMKGNIDVFREIE